jgi:pimeloyl-ACP methyl ester carboxylesterase
MKTLEPSAHWAERPIQTAGAETFRRRVMRLLGHQRFTLAGHDRRGRAAYRMALDQPEAVTAVLPLQALPSAEVRQRLRPRTAVGRHVLAEEDPQARRAALLPRRPHAARGARP